MRSDSLDLPLLEPEKDGTWTLMADWRSTLGGVKVTVPFGFHTDGASIPRLLWRICGHPMEAPRLYAAIRHDWHYSGGDSCIGRSDADRIYRNDQIDLGICRTKAWVEFVALRMFGWAYWHENKKGKGK